jgi:hypothetical protein
MHYDRSPGAPEHFRLVLRLRPRDERDHLSRAGPDQGAYKRHAGRALPRSCGRSSTTGRTWTVIRFALEPGQMDVGGGALTLPVA